MRNKRERTEKRRTQRCENGGGRRGVPDKRGSPFFSGPTGIFVSSGSARHIEREVIAAAFVAAITITYAARRADSGRV